jgi:hypothetical protein
MAIVYQHRRLDNNEIFYIGIGKEESRAYNKKNRTNYWKHIINKYGYVIEITHKDIIWEEACSIEKYLISFWGRKDLGKGLLVNMTDGGDGVQGKIIRKETKQKMSESQKGKKHTEETKEKMSISQKNRKPRSKETIEKMSDSHKGKKMSEEAKQKMSEYKKGKLSNMLGKKHSEKTKQKISESKKGKKHTK